MGRESLHVILVQLDSRRRASRGVAAPPTMETADGKTVVARRAQTPVSALRSTKARIAVERSDGQAALLNRDGRLLGRIAPGGPAPRPVRSPGFAALDRPTVGLSGRDLVVLRAGRLLVYDTASLRLRRSLAVAHRAKLARVADGLVADVVGADIHILVCTTRAARPYEPELGRGVGYEPGLFHALYELRVSANHVAPFRRNPATVGFLAPRAILGASGAAMVRYVLCMFEDAPQTLMMALLPGPVGAL